MRTVPRSGRGRDILRNRAEATRARREPSPAEAQGTDPVAARLTLACRPPSSLPEVRHGESGSLDGWGGLSPFVEPERTEHKMDTRPLREINMLDFAEADVAGLRQFAKSSFNLGHIAATAMKLECIREIELLLAAER